MRGAIAHSPCPMDPSQPPATAPKYLPGPLVALLAVAFFGGLIGLFVWSRSTIAHGGPLALGAVGTGEVGVLSELHHVPGRPSYRTDQAERWLVPLNAGETVTLQVCWLRSRSRAGSVPMLAVSGPQGENDHPMAAGIEGGLERRVIVYTPSTTGTHTVWVHRQRAAGSVSYRVQVTRGAQPDPPATLCM